MIVPRALRTSMLTTLLATIFTLVRIVESRFETSAWRLTSTHSGSYSTSGDARAGIDGRLLGGGCSKRLSSRVCGTFQPSRATTQQQDQ
jgi:hypothetical protein